MMVKLCMQQKKKNYNINDIEKNSFYLNIDNICFNKISFLDKFKNQIKY